MADYARADQLTDGAWLQAHLNDPNLRIVDCDVRDAFRRAHIPGAACPADNFFKNPDDRRFIMQPEQFAQAMADLGIGDDSQVVTYDQGGNTAARLWWCLNYYGFTNVRVLNGGINQWLADGRPLTQATASPKQTSAFTPKPVNEAMYATAEYIMSKLEQPGVVVLDVRSDGEWNGTNTRGNKRQGHMPGAVHLEWTNNLEDGALKRWKSANELKSMFEAAGVTPDKEVITVCQGGIRAAQAAFTLSLIGYDNVRDYDGSFGDWGNRDDTPIV